MVFTSIRMVPESVNTISGRILGLQKRKYFEEVEEDWPLPNVEETILCSSVATPDTSHSTKQQNQDMLMQYGKMYYYYYLWVFF